MGPSDKLNRKLIDAIDRLGNALRVARQRTATAFGVTILQLQILEVIADGRPRRVGDIAAELDVSSPTVSDAVASLEFKGAVERHQDVLDGRATIVSLTPEGNRLADEVASTMEPLLSALDRSHPGDQATALSVVLESIAALHRAGMISIDHGCLTCHHYEPAANAPTARCNLLDLDISTAALRVNCLEHVPA